MLESVVKLVKNCRSCVVLTGAGISAESGVPTFRGKEGLWGKFRAEELATMEAFMANPEIVWEWYGWRRKILSEVQPNDGHRALVQLAHQFKRFTLITQNVDGLHEKAGSTNILELHGNISRNKCVKCSEPFPATVEIDPAHIPICQSCGGQIRPDVVWFGEMLDENIIDRAFYESEETELFFSIGTSALVHPAASLPVTAKRHGATLIEINPEETPLTYLADISIRAKSGEFLPQVVALLSAGVATT
jgi:NAD-dependent deacetylase